MRTFKPLILLGVFIGVSALNQQQLNHEPAKHDLELIKYSKNIFIAKKTKKQFDKPSEAAAWIADALTTPKGLSPAQLNLQYQAKLKAERAEKTNQNLPALAFEELGPGVFGGRIRGFVIHPEREGHLLAGGVFGGVWKSIDDGQSWEPKTDFLENIAIGSMLIDPDNPEKVYVGTGEGFFNFDAARGFGIFVSEDFGETWAQLPSTTNTNFLYVNRISRVPNSNVLLAATRTGIFRSVNLGQTWTEVSGLATQERGFTDLQIDPSDSQHLLAYHFGSENVTKDLIVTAPANLARAYVTAPANFGAEITTTGVTGTIETVNDDTDTTFDGCETITNDLTGKIALIERGGCNFTVKVANAQNAGAIGAVVYQNSNDAPFPMGGEDDSITIPAVMIEKSIGETFRTTPEVISGGIKTGDEAVLNRFVMRSTDAGSTWTKLENQGLPVVGVLRMEIGFGTDGKTYVAASKDAEELEDGGTNGTIGLYRSVGADNQNFEKAPSNTNFVERQGWYDMAIAVNPSDSDHVIMGAVDLYSTNNGGDSINRNTFWFSPAGFIDQYIHADHHGYFFSPHNSNHIYVVNDGGVAKSEDGGNTWLALNNGLNISQSYGIAVSPDGQQVISGTQDNGAKLYFGDQQTWLPWAGGDGGYSAWDQQQPQFIYGSFPNGEIYGSDDGGLSIQLMALPDTEGARFIQPFILDGNDGNRMLVGTDKVYFSNDARSLDSASWSDVTGSINDSGVSALAFNPHQSTIAYAGMATSDTQGTNQIIQISGLGSTNTITDIAPPSSLGVDGTVVTDIKVDIFDTSGNTIYATFGGYFSNRILKTTDGGNSWVSISSNLPNMPLWQVVNDPSDPSVLYVGSELGLWVGTQAGNSYNWEQFDYGPAFTRVIDLVWRGNELFIGTHGRGTYKASKNPVAVSLVKFIADNSSCDLDNYLDRGESGELVVAIENLSAKNLNAVTLDFDLPGMISFTNGNQTIALGGFTKHQISIPVKLNNNASCLTDVQIPVSINIGSSTYDSSIQLLTAANQSVNTGTFEDGAENTDSQLNSQLAFGNDGWIRVTDRVSSGTNSWFTTNENAYSDKSLVTPWLTFDGGGNVLTFAMSYDTEGDARQYWDGLVLEMRLEDSDLWFDIGNLSSVPYDGQLSTNNTAQAQFAWSGTRLAWREATVNLGTKYTGETVQIRWRMVSDTNSSQEGFWLDDIAISNVLVAGSPTCDACISNDESKIPNKGLWYDPAYDGHGFIIESVGTNNLFYTMFYTYDDIGNPEWYNSVTQLQGGVLNPEFATGTINAFTYDYDIDPTIADPFILDAELDGRLTINFNNAEVRNHPACQDGTSRNLDFAALAKWKLNDEESEWCIEPLVSNAARPDPDFGTGWWGGSDENGWGYSLAQVNDVMIAYIFYYDADGNPRWANGFNTGFEPNQNITIPMNDVYGYGRDQAMIDRTLVPNGSITLNLANTFRNLDTDGTTSVDITYQGIEGGRWLRDNIKIMTLLQEH